MRRSLLLVVCALVVLAGATPAQGTTFTGTGEYAVGPRPSHLAMGDLDGDGAPDLVVANNGVQPDGTDAPGFNTVSVLLGAPGGTFAPAVPYTVGDNPAFVTVVDLDGDAAPDIAVTSLGSQTLSILLGNGDGTFAPALDYDAGPRPRGVASGDFDGDGDPDLAVANRDGARTTVLLGNGDGTLGAPVGYDTGESGPALVVVADVNNDGQADLAVTN